MTPEEVLAVARIGRKAGCKEARFRLWMSLTLHLNAIQELLLLGIDLVDWRVKRIAALFGEILCGASGDAVFPVFLQPETKRHTIACFPV